METEDAAMGRWTCVISLWDRDPEDEERVLLDRRKLWGD